MSSKNFGSGFKLKTIHDRVAFESLLAPLLVLLLVIGRFFPNSYRSVIKFLLSPSPVQLDVFANFLNQLSLLLIGICVTVFVLAVTLLGNAAKIAKEKKDLKEGESKEEFDQGILNLKKEIKEIEENGKETKDLQAKLQDFELKKNYTDNEIKKIDRKYKSLHLHNSVVWPSALFAGSAIFANWIVVGKTFLSQITPLVFSTSLILFGLKKMFLTLSTIEEVAIEADQRKKEVEQERATQLQESIASAINNVEAKKEPRPFITFLDKPPFVFKADSEEEIKFAIGLKEPGSSEAKNLDLWFLLSPEIEIVPDVKYGSSSFRQDSTYGPIPDANTLIYKLSSIKRYVKNEYSIKIKTTIPGEYKLRYKVDCDSYSEHAGPDKEIGIIVK